MNHFYLIRHGEQENIAGDPSLSNLGIIQAQKTADFIKQFPVDKVMSSPIRRTQETAAYIANALQRQYEVDTLLKERANWGDDPNQTFQEFDAMWNKSVDERNWQPPVGDSSINSGKRLETVIKNLNEGQNKHIVLVTHGGIIADFLRNVFSEDELNSHIAGFAIQPTGKVTHCSITILETTTLNSQYKLKTLASTEHLS